MFNRPDHLDGDGQHGTKEDMADDIKKLLEEHKDDIKRHFDTVAEDLKGEIQQVAEGVTANTRQLERLAPMAWSRFLIWDYTLVPNPGAAYGDKTGLTRTAII